MALCAFLKTNPWFNACFKFLIYTTYSVLSCKLAANFSTFSIFILLCKKGKNHCEGYVNVLIIEHQLKKIKSSLKSEIYSTHLKSFTYNF